MNNEIKLQIKETRQLNFIEEIIEKEKNNNSFSGVHTRFPPEPNGYLHIGHAKSICLNFGLAKKYNGKCNLRFDDTNPVAEDVEYVDSIKEDIRWLGFDWENRLFYASDYFQQLYEWAKVLIKKEKSFVCDLTADEVSRMRGTPAIPATPSPFRNRSVEENLNLFERMKNGEFPDGSKTLRAKIDLASPNMHMRDPVLYRILHASHHRTGNKWCIYPMYDFAHGQSDYIERITHSICTLEFEVHRPLYEWFLNAIGLNPPLPRQIEFARLNLSFTVMSKRKLMELVKGNYVNGWDDPRMPTICGLRHRGYTPESIRNFAERIGVAKRENTIDVSLLEFCIREDLNKKTNRIMGVLNPVKVIITNFPDNQTEELNAINNPEDASAGNRKVPFSKELFIERDDFMENPPNNYFRLSPGKEVRLRYAYYIKCNNIIKNPQTCEITEIHCTYDTESKGGKSADGRKVKGTIHWVSAKHAVECEVRLYDRLFKSENPEEGQDFKEDLNPDSLKIVKGYLEPSVKTAKVGENYQFERLGYFVVDKDTTTKNIVFNRTVSLKDVWSKTMKNK
ncbi:MAG: glutamine--tRNA ligase [Bacteroidetes bacterium CG23_combo_of_CG06-09_8_20_14_all_32_9]|nr:MAG: glutamine--tRNA ligase [Bacteroidetes bacterium CG23_combo_of_CG06-09_8_20_14_all_32_9]